MGFLSFIMRPFVGDQTTGRLAYQKYQGLAFSGINGNGGQMVKRSMAATSKGSIVPGPTHKLNDPFVTGNTSQTVVVQELTDTRNI